MDAGQGVPSADVVLASDRDRERVVQLLQERTADGSLTLDEFADRVGRALALRRRDELDTLVADLPAPAVVDAPRRKARHRVLAVMAGAEVKGRWRCEESVVAIAVMGGCHIDFRGAEISTDTVRVTAVAFMGGIDIVVPEGVEVTMDGLPVMGGRSMQVKDVPPLTGAPRIVVHAFPIMGGVTVRSRPPRSARTNGDAVTEPQPVHEPPRSPLPLDGTVTVMFIDVCDYSGMTHRLGDAAVHDLLREHTQMVRRQVEANDGHEVKSNGDGLMVVFPSVARAIRCAVAVQNTLAERNRERPDEPVGIHAGEVVRDGTDFLGSTVIVASRLTDVAGPDEVLVSSVARALVDGSREFVFDEPRTVTLKGLADAREVHPVRWAP
jgi:class 3 adenylate cyclase